MNKNEIPGDVPPHFPSTSRNLQCSDDHVETAVHRSEKDTVDAIKSDVTEHDEFFYDMTQKQKGIFLIFNHENFESDLELPARKGTSVDEQGLKRVWENLGFVVKIFNDLKAEKIHSTIKSYVSCDHSRYGSFACAILSHGSDGDEIYAYDGSYHIKELYEPFRGCQTLIGKPKMFFVQACRGKKLQDGKKKDVTDADGRREITIPFEADFLIAFSTVEGYYSWRNPMTGSWFIQSMIECIEKYADKWDLMKILTRVNREVCCKESNPDLVAMKGKKQCPSIISRLTAQVYLKQNVDDVPDSKANTSVPKTEPLVRTPTEPGLSMVAENPVIKENDVIKQEYYKMKLKSLKLRQQLTETKQKLCELKLRNATDY